MLFLVFKSAVLASCKLSEHCRDPLGATLVFSKPLHAVCLYWLKTAHGSLNNLQVD